MFIRFRTRTVTTFSLLPGVLSTPTMAGDITVYTTADHNVANGQCSLREAMQAQFTGDPLLGALVLALGPNLQVWAAWTPTKAPH